MLSFGSIYGVVGVFCFVLLEFDQFYHYCLLCFIGLYLLVILSLLTVFICLML
ncbi:hypothetical protein BDW42DRAFT_178938 [Aspergillus taichungensis]|uniref:Uncharacterized protein n=1 Tax=Aspergillus taichungensis TaxID=482145 RepID=A0A2J5HHE9_9EURO|nr:hypothetical protein BDW42DRAFT_178938 [Aspergillus taichungensis]